MATSCEDLKAGRFTPLDLAAVARTTFDVRELNSAEVAELSFGRPLSENSTAEITAALSVDNQLIALLKNVSGKAKPVAVFAAAH
jgi:tRNA pseudouridine55 synthase